jgi:hypothetical protein
MARISEETQELETIEEPEIVILVESPKEPVINIGDLVEVFNFTEKEFNGMQYTVVSFAFNTIEVKNSNGYIAFNKQYLRKVC